MCLAWTEAGKGRKLLQAIIFGVRCCSTVVNACMCSFGLGRFALWAWPGSPRSAVFWEPAPCCTGSCGCPCCGERLSCWYCVSQLYLQVLVCILLHCFHAWSSSFFPPSGTSLKSEEKFCLCVKWIVDCGQS